MTVREAQKTVRRLSADPNISEEDQFELNEALAFLIEELHDPADMMHLGGIHYDERNFDLALKYYEMAASYDYDDAYECLGYIWYYGRTGEVDYKKAFEYFSKAAEAGNIIAEYKVADMYKNGYYVEQDYDKYCRTIESLYPRVRNTDYLGDPLPEISLRLASIHREQGRIEEAQCERLPIQSNRCTAMKKITMFHIEECKYCDFARRAIAELREEFPQYRDVEIEMVNENEHPEIVENYDYWSVPSLFIDKDKIFEAALFMPYETVRDGVKLAFDTALAG